MARSLRRRPDDDGPGSASLVPANPRTPLTPASTARRQGAEPTAVEVADRTGRVVSDPAGTD